MLPEPPATKPRRNWHLLRWAFVLIALSFGWGAWKAYDFRQAVKEAKELGWQFTYNDPVAIIRRNWRAAFRKETWSDTRRELFTSSGDHMEGHFGLIRRLAPNGLLIRGTYPQHDLSELKGLPNLDKVGLHECSRLTNIDALMDMKGLSYLAIEGSRVLATIDALKELKKLEGLDLRNCTALTSVDALRELKALKHLVLIDCTGLQNVDGILGLTGMEQLYLDGCTGLTKEAVDAVKAALPNTRVISDYGE